MSARVRIACVAWLAALACDAAVPPAAPAGVTAPVGVAAGVVIEPPRIRLGDTAIVEVAVVTPPGHRVAPLDAPEAITGLWLLEAEAPVLVREPARWIHRTRFRVRARATGETSWPESSARVEAPDGSEHLVPIEARPLEVIEVSPEQPPRLEPFSFRVPARTARPTGFALPALLGAATALAGVALFSLVRRVRARQAAVALQETAGEAPWRATEALLTRALAEVDEDPVAAADRASLALRHYVGARFRTRAACETTEELSASEPPFAMTSRWPGFVGTLRSLDATRFRPGPLAHASEEVRSAIRAAAKLVAETAPQGGRR